MREILFRGKDIKTGEWVEGAYYHQTEFYGDADDEHHIITSKDELEDNMMECYRVIPETVGQYTGLTDKNGTKIFEGDIVRRYDNVERVFYDGGGFSPFAIPGWECTPDADKCEVVGNIHDNPELLANK